TCGSFTTKGKKMLLRVMNIWFFYHERQKDALSGNEHVVLLPRKAKDALPGNENKFFRQVSRPTTLFLHPLF
ncbi:hypothetical protein V7149_22605, partial [Bacillus sp. JJ1503]|uniref:hypothetical protein n=1 Tax=Bacillus sp. JJ1503 TaxID=3122956 RepID=UPI002FFEB9D4